MEHTADLMLGYGSSFGEEELSIFLVGEFSYTFIETSSFGRISNRIVVFSSE